MAVYEFDQPAIAAGPGPMFARMRSQGPSLRARLPAIGEVWGATTQAAMAAIGHQLAQLEACVALGILPERHPGLRLAVEPQAVKWRPRAGLQAIEALPVSDR